MYNYWYLKCFLYKSRRIVQSILWLNLMHKIVVMSLSNTKLRYKSWVQITFVSSTQPMHTVVALFFFWRWKVYYFPLLSYCISIYYKSHICLWYVLYIIMIMPHSSLHSRITSHMLCKTFFNNIKNVQICFKKREMNSRTKCKRIKRRSKNSHSLNFFYIISCKCENTPK